MELQEPRRLDPVSSSQPSLSRFENSRDCKLLFHLSEALAEHCKLSFGREPVLCLIKGGTVGLRIGCCGFFRTVWISCRYGNGDQDGGRGTSEWRRRSC